MLIIYRLYVKGNNIRAIELHNMQVFLKKTVKRYKIKAQKGKKLLLEKQNL